MLAQQVPGPGQTIGGSFVASYKYDFQLIQQLLFIHGLARILVAGVEQHLQEVVAGFATVLALVYQFADGIFEVGGEGFMLFGFATQGPPPIEVRLANQLDDKSLNLGDLPAHFLHLLLGHIDAENRTHDDAKSHVHHVLGHVDRASFDFFVKFGQTFLDHLVHQMGEAGQTGAVKTGLNQTALPQPMVTIDGEQTLSYKMPQMFEVNWGFFVHPMVLLQNMLDKNRIGSKSSRNDATNVKAIGVAILSHIAPDGRDGVAEEFERVDQGFDARDGGDRAGHGGGI